MLRGARERCDQLAYSCEGTTDQTIFPKHLQCYLFYNIPFATMSPGLSHSQTLSTYCTAITLSFTKWPPSRYLLLMNTPILLSLITWLYCPKCHRFLSLTHHLPAHEHAYLLLSTTRLNPTYSCRRHFPSHSCLPNS